MDERVTPAFASRSLTSQTPHGAAVGDVVEAIAAAAIELAALIADGPLAGITGANGGTNTDGDQQKDIDVAADEMMRQRTARRTGRGDPFRGSGAAGNARSRGAALRRDRSARRLGQSRKQHLDRHHLFDPPERQRHPLDLLRARHGAVRRRLLRLWAANHARSRAQCQRRHLHSRPPHAQVPADQAGREDRAAIRRNSPSTPPIAGTGTGRCAPTSTNASPAPTAAARRISTCAGSARWWRSRFASWCAAACSFIRPTPAPAIAKGGFACCTKPIRWRCHGVGGRCGDRPAATNSGIGGENTAPAGAADHGLGARRSRRHRHPRRHRADVRQ